MCFALRLSSFSAFTALVFTLTAPCAWGDDSRGQCDVPAELTNAVAVAGGGAHSLALGPDGTVTAWGADWNGQCDVPFGWFPAAGITAGNYHTVLLADPSAAARQQFYRMRQW